VRAAINAVFGSASLVQRCRQHKLRNVAERLPNDQQAQTKSLMRAAWKLDAKEGITKLEKLAKWLEREHPDAADSLREGMEECFTIHRMDIPPSLHRYLASTNLIEKPSFGSSPADQASMPMAGQADGEALGSCGHAGDREEFPSRYGSQGHVGAQSYSRWQTRENR